MKNNMTQINSIFSFLNSGRRINHLEAERRFGCTRLAARIKDLRNIGWNIETIPCVTKKGKRFAAYELVNR